MKFVPWSTIKAAHVNSLSDGLYNLESYARQICGERVISSQCSRLPKMIKAKPESRNNVVHRTTPEIDGVCDTTSGSRCSRTSSTFDRVDVLRRAISRPKNTAPRAKRLKLLAHG